MMSMKCHVIVLDKRNAFPYFKCRYLHDKQLVEILGRKAFMKGVIDRFHVDPNHILNERGKLGFRKKMPLIIVDNATRTSVQLTGDDSLDAKERNKLNYLIEEAFWLALLQKVKTPLSKILILIFAGIGVWQLVRAILIIMGLASGPI